jgi:carbonic anhydrase
LSEIENLIQGYRRFHENYFDADEQLFNQLAHGQKPATLVIACSDSRVDPAIITDSKPGDLFVVRNVANLVPPYEVGGGYHGVSSALEFGVQVLEVKHIIVFGHRQCGGIRALVDGIEEGAAGGEFIAPWMNMAQRAYQRVLADNPHGSSDEHARACELGGVMVSLENLMTFPWIKSRVEEGKLELHGWYFDIESGEILAYNTERLVFEAIR